MRFSNLILLLLSMYSSVSCSIENLYPIGLCGQSVQSVASTKTIANGLNFTKYVLGREAKKDILLSPLYSGSELHAVRTVLEDLLPYEKVSITEAIQKDVLGNKIGTYFTFYSRSKTDLLLFKSEISKRGIELGLRSESQSQCASGVINISVLKLVPSAFTGSVVTGLSKGRVRGLDKVSNHVENSIFKNTTPVAAVNGGYFVIRKDQGYLGDPAGVSVIGGRLVSEAVNGRPALLIRNGSQVNFDVLEDVRTEAFVHNEGKKIQLLGINRQLGKVFNCGLNEGQFTFVSHDSVCSLTDDFVMYDDYFGTVDDVVNSNATYVVIDDHGVVVSSNSIINGMLPTGYHLLAATGGRYTKVLESMRGKVEYSWNVYSHEAIVPMDENTYLINGGPTLLNNGEIQYSRFKQEGWDTIDILNTASSADERDGLSVSSESTKRANFYKDWLLTRHPRTAVGIDSKGNAYFVVVYGRNPLYSDGISVPELAQFFHSLGIRKAINLDGGGSSAMYLDGKLTGIPSDSEGERNVAEAIIISK